jgi:hypothetical protein
VDFSNAIESHFLPSAHHDVGITDALLLLSCAPLLLRAAAMLGDTDGAVCWVCQFADCDERPDEPLLSTGCACCRAESTGGWAHVSCLARAAVHQVHGATAPKLWRECPTCQHFFTGAVEMGLGHARWELYRNHPEADDEFLGALDHLAGAHVNAGDDVAARPLYDKLVAAQRQGWGDDNPNTLAVIGRLGGVLSRMGEDTAAQPLLEEALAGLRMTAGGDDDRTLDTMLKVAHVHMQVGAMAKARLLLEEAAAAFRRRTNPVDPHKFAASIGTLGTVVVNAGDNTGLALRSEAAAFARRELGPEHPLTKESTRLSVQLACSVAQDPPGTRAAGTLVGLVSKAELNGKQALVIGFDTAKGRYHVCPRDAFHTGKTIGIKPANLILKQGSAVIVQGLEAAPEWNGKRGLVESYDTAKGRYRLLMKERTKVLGVKAAVCKLEFAVEQERQEHEATRRAEVVASVNAALAARAQSEKHEKAA